MTLSRLTLEQRFEMRDVAMINVQFYRWRSDYAMRLFAMAEQKEETRINGAKQKVLRVQSKFDFRHGKIDASPNAYIPVPRYKQYIRHIRYTETVGNIASDIR